MYRNKFNGFSTLEVILVLGIVSILLAVCAPHITKAMKGFNNPECSGGYRTVRKAFVNDAKFTIPSDASREIRFTLVGAGGGGANGSIKKDDEPIINDATCSLGLPEGYQFYTNVYLDAIEEGSACLVSGVAGASGNFVHNILIKMQRGTTYSYTCGSAEKPSGSGTAKSGMTGNSGAPIFLQGGVGDVYIMTKDGLAGVGESCVWDNAKSEYAGINKGSAACKISYKTATPGAGGGAGAYASFVLDNLSGNTQCDITIGKGGSSGADGNQTSITCGNTKYYVGGGYGAKNTTGGLGSNTFSSNIPTKDNDYKIQGGYGNVPDTTTIAGGAGGNTLKSGNPIIFSKGGLGGCNGAMTSVDCENPNGEDGISPSSDLRYAGSGGGGGSCNENGCGRGGFGADGIVIIEYRAKCY